MSHDPAKPSDQRVMCLSRLELVKVKYHFTKFDGHRHSSSGHIMVFVCLVTLQDHVIKVLNDFMYKSPLRYISILPSLVVIGTVAEEI